MLQGRLVERAVETACAAAVGPVSLWTAPDETHPAFQAISARLAIALARQAEGDLGARMLAAITQANSCVLVIGSDCPALTPDHLRTAAEVLRNRADVVVIPAEDGGYALIGMRTPQPALFSDMPWSTPGVMDETRRRLRTLGLTWHEPTTLWDVDLPRDLERMRTIGLHDLIPSGGA
jgi:rSAM/selenodomain-associated transferase 1